MIKKTINKYKHSLMFLYALIYMPWFAYLEATVTKNFRVIHMDLDNYIPFNEFFIIPYFLWFAYVAIAISYFFFKDSREFYRLTSFLFAGMTIFLVVSTFFPNGHHLRPLVFERDNIFVGMVKQLYRIDTPTNIFPSIHVFNSIVVHISIVKSHHLADKKWLHLSSFVLMSLIVLSTVLLKQHSVFDVITAILMVCILYPIIKGFETMIINGRKKRYHESYDRI